MFKEKKLEHWLIDLNYRKLSADSKIKKIMPTKLVGTYIFYDFSFIIRGKLSIERNIIF